MGTLSLGVLPNVFSDKIREIEFDHIANSHLIFKKDRFISRPMTEPSFNFN